jgi:hypothetical protein
MVRVRVTGEAEAKAEAEAEVKVKASTSMIGKVLTSYPMKRRRSLRKTST